MHRWTAAGAAHELRASTPPCNGADCKCRLGEAGLPQVALFVRKRAAQSGLKALSTWTCLPKSARVWQVPHKRATPAHPGR